MGENIERLFYEDVREKKKTGSGSFHKRGKGVKHGFNNALRTPSYYMKKKEKDKLNGEVKMFNMYSNPITMEEFKTFDISLQKEMLAKWRDEYDNATIRKGMGLTNVQYYALVSALDLPKKVKTGGRKPMKQKREAKIKSVAVTPNQEKLAAISTKEEQMELEGIEKNVAIQTIPINPIYLQTPPPQVEDENIMFRKKGLLNAEAIIKLLTKAQLIVDGEEDEFEFSICIKEKN